MLLINCPFCGPREQTEFGYHGEAHIARPSNPDSVGDAEWGDYLFFRANPKGIHRERWSHDFGCRRWFNMARDTVSGEIVGVYLHGEKPPTDNDDELEKLLRAIGKGCFAEFFPLFKQVANGTLPNNKEAVERLQKATDYTENSCAMRVAKSVKIIKSGWAVQALENIRDSDGVSESARQQAGWLSGNPESVHMVEFARRFVAEFGSESTCITFGNHIEMRIPGSSILVWFEEQKEHCRISFRLPQNEEVETLLKKEGFPSEWAASGGWYPVPIPWNEMESHRFLLQELTARVEKEAK